MKRETGKTLSLFVPTALLAAAGLLVLSGCGAKQHNVSYPPLAIKVVKRRPPKKKVLKKIAITDRVQFKKNSARLLKRSHAVLDQVVAVLEKNRAIRLVEIQGHTDDRGSDKRNLRLSQRRADSVRTYLMDQGVEAERLTAKGYGEERPMVANDSAENRRINRRVEFQILEQQTTTMAQGG